MRDLKDISRRRWFQFSLLTLLILVVLAAGLLVAWRVYVEPFRQQFETSVLIEKLGGSCTTSPGGASWLRRLDSDTFQDIVNVDMAECDDSAAYIDHISCLPRLKMLTVAGPTFTDEHLSRLRQINSLRTLILDSTSVGDNAITAFKQALPSTLIHKSRWKAIAVIRNLGILQLRPRDDRKNRQLRLLIGEKHFENARAVDLSVDKPEKVGDRQVAWLQHLTTVELLRLNNTRVTNAGLSHIKGLTQLRLLELNNTLISDAGLVHLKGLIKLEYLRCNYTQIGDTGLAHLKRLTSLQQLYLNGTQVGDAGVGQLDPAVA